MLVREFEAGFGSRSVQRGRSHSRHCTIAQGEGGSAEVTTPAAAQRQPRIRIRATNRDRAASLSCFSPPVLCLFISQLLQTEKNVGRAAAAASSAMDIDDGKKAASAAAAAAPASGELPESVLNILTVTSTALSKTRKATIKEAAATVASVAEIQSFKITDKSHALHATTNPGILCVDVQKMNQDHVLTGGNDGKALLFSRASGKIVSHITGHKSAVVAAKFSPSDADVLFTASLDQQAIMWRADGASKFNAVHTFSGARDALTSLSVHASGALVATGSKDGSWALFDCTKGSELKRVNVGTPVSTACFHPDGVILAAGGAVDGVVRVFDLKSCKLAASLKDQHTSGLTAFSFSENGFHCASADVSGIVKLWDLRKLTAFHTLPAAGSEGDKAGSIVSALSFDESASYLAVASGSRVLIHGTKGWEQVMQLAEHKERVTGVAWGSQARAIVSVGMDRQLKVWA